MPSDAQKTHIKHLISSKFPGEDPQTPFPVIYMYVLRCPENAYQALDFSKFPGVGTPRPLRFGLRAFGARIGSWLQNFLGRTPRPPFPVIYVLRCPENAYQALDFSKFPGGGPPPPAVPPMGQFRVEYCACRLH